MFEMFRSSRSASGRNTQTDAPSTTGSSIQSQNPINYRDLVRMVLRDTLRLNGIPIELIKWKPDADPCLESPPWR